MRNLLLLEMQINYLLSGKHAAISLRFFTNYKLKVCNFNYTFDRLYKLYENLKWPFKV